MALRNEAFDGAPLRERRRPCERWLQAAPAARIRYRPDSIDEIRAREAA
jgi:hypothetical protein